MDHQNIMHAQYIGPCCIPFYFSDCQKTQAHCYFLACAPKTYLEKYVRMIKLLKSSVSLIKVMKVNNELNQIITNNVTVQILPKDLVQTGVIQDY